MARLVAAHTPPLLDHVRRLFADYAASLDVDLAYQGFAAELERLPGEYAPPRGALFLAIGEGDAALGCVALRPFDWPLVAELKRLFVTPQGRGRGLGRILSLRALHAAREAGYDRVRLDTLPSMAAAQRMYQRLGFRDIAPYRFSPVAGTRYMELELRALIPDAK